MRIPTDRQALRRHLATIAAEQSGYFTASQALKVGYSYPAQKFHVDRGNWTRVGRGLFRLPEWPVGEYDDLVRWSLWSKGRAIVSHETALGLHHLGVTNPAIVHLTVPPNFRMRASSVRIHRTELPESDITHYEGFRATTPVRTILDVSAANLELDELVSAIQDANERYPQTKDELLTRAEEFGPRAALRIERALRLGGLL